MGSTGSQKSRQAADRAQGRRFNLVRWFLVLSFTSIAITSTASAYFLSRFLKDNMLRRDAVVTMEFVNSIVRAEKADEHLIASDPDQGNEALERLFTQIASIPEVIRANLYGQSRVILWSSAPEFIGAVFQTNRELDEAFQGELEFEEGTVGENKKAEHAFLEGEGSRFVENYLPIWSKDGKEVIGVAEVYKSSAPLYQAIDRGNRLVWNNALAGGAILYIVLTWIIYRANIVMIGQRQRLAESEALAAIGEMATAVAHGLRNPLASIRSSAELSLDDDPPAAVNRSLKEIIGQSDRLERWIRELLTSSRPESFDMEPLQVNHLLAEIGQAFSGQMARQGVRLNFNLASDLRSVQGNAAALGPVINSLIANALEAMPSGGSVVVSTAMSPDGQHVDISIIDSGHGISDGETRDLFQPFVTTKGAGLGIGLPLAKRIIERHHGDLKLSPAPGGGTIAKIEIPTAD